MRKAILQYLFILNISLQAVLAVHVYRLVRLQSIATTDYVFIAPYSLQRKV